ncbi:choline kinase family protein [Parahaliea maris]|uniref:choline kinase family protein n=1 Tax=Parahaliea maris TaxID=2716870 RepID=UPI00164F13A2|nr:choline kinase family protein [Parahaliea maris]
MVTPLPRDRQLRLAQVLGQWRHWSCLPALGAEPTVQGELSAGFSNASYRVTSDDGRQFVVRLDGVDPAHHGISRQAEWHALHSAFEAGLTAQPCYFNPDLGALVCHYLPEDEDSRDDLEDVAQLLRRIHALPALHHRLDLQERTIRYRRHTGTMDSATDALLRSLTATVDEVLAWQRTQNDRCLCHNDLLAANRLYSGGKLYALDWEYCAMGSRWFDLAVVCCGDELAPENVERLLYSYLQRAPESGDRQYLAAYSLLYRYIEMLWYAATSPENMEWRNKSGALRTTAERVKSNGLP